MSVPLVLERGNLTEEFRLPLQFFALYLYLVVEDSESTWLGTGMNFGLIGTLWRARVLVATEQYRCFYYNRTRHAARESVYHRFGWGLTALVALATGFILVTGSSIVYFALNNAFLPLIDAVFVYSNYRYSISSWQDKFSVF